MPKTKNRGTKVFIKRYSDGGLEANNCFNAAHLLAAQKKYRGNKVNIFREIQSAVLNEKRRLAKKVVIWLEEMAEKYRIVADFLALYQHQTSLMSVT
ncbi:hypothetical protein GW830_03180 [bacterium]|nr:hypothetical protein [bacterium]